eukprot:768156-Hanusia_phi.AAC.4
MCRKEEVESIGGPRFDEGLELGDLLAVLLRLLGGGSLIEGLDPRPLGKQHAKDLSLCWTGTASQSL